MSETKHGNETSLNCKEWEKKYAFIVELIRNGDLNLVIEMGSEDEVVKTNNILSTVYSWRLTTLAPYVTEYGFDLVNEFIIAFARDCKAKSEPKEEAKEEEVEFDTEQIVVIPPKVVEHAEA